MGWGLSRRARARLLTAIAALAASVVLVPTSASAHSELVASNPSDDSVVDHVPDHVVLEFVDPVSVDDDSVQVVGPDGEVLEQGLLPAGESRSYAAGEVARVVLGNAPAVKVLHAGKTVDLAPFTRANVARFTVSSDGSVAAAAD